MQDFERRLAALERTNRRYRLCLTAALSFLALVALGGFERVAQTQTFPRQIVADSINVQSLTAFSGTINQLGANRADVQYLAVRDGSADSLALKRARVNDLVADLGRLGKAVAASVEVRSGDTGSWIQLSSSRTSAGMSVFSPSGELSVNVASNQGKGLLTLATQGKTCVQATADQDAGSLEILSASGKPLLSLANSHDGDGELVVRTRNGNRAVWAGCDQRGEFGQFVVANQGATPLVRLDATAEGGVVTTFKGPDETARMPAKG